MSALDNPAQVVEHLHEASAALAKAHKSAGEDGDRTGPVRDLIFGLATALEAFSDLVIEATP